jgi:hypothetical protein
MTVSPGHARETRMSRPTHVYIVASPRPRAGGTLLARTLVEFFHADGRPVRAFDLDTFDGALAGFVPNLTVRTDINDTRGQITLFDQLIVGDDRPKVVDVGARAFEPFFNLMELIEFAAEAPLHAVEPVILYAANTDPQSVKGYAQLRERFPGVLLAPIYNDGIVRGRNLRPDFPGLNVITLPLRIPMMSPALRAAVEAPGFSFAEFRRHAAAAMTPALETELNSWLKRVHLQFREMELRLLMTSLRGTLKEPPPRQQFDSAPPPG